MRIGRCEVCGNVGEVWVCCSTCGSICVSYCADCLKAKAEPWDLLVDYISCAGHYPKDISLAYQEVVKSTCKRLGKTEEEFAESVDYEIENDTYPQWVARHPDWDFEPDHDFN